MPKQTATKSMEISSMSRNSDSEHQRRRGRIYRTLNLRQMLTKIFIHIDPELPVTIQMRKCAKAGQGVHVQICERACPIAVAVRRVFGQKLRQRR